MLRRAALRSIFCLMFPNWPGVAVDDEGSVWLSLRMDFNVDETLFSFAGMPD